MVKFTFISTFKNLKSKQTLKLRFSVKNGFFYLRFDLSKLRSSFSSKTLISPAKLNRLEKLAFCIFKGKKLYRAISYDLI